MDQAASREPRSEMLCAVSRGLGSDDNIYTTRVFPARIIPRGFMFAIQETGTDAVFFLAPEDYEQEKKWRDARSA